MSCGKVSAQGKIIQQFQKWHTQDVKVIPLDIREQPHAFFLQFIAPDRVSNAVPISRHVVGQIIVADLPHPQPNLTDMPPDRFTVFADNRR